MQGCLFYWVSIIGQLKVTGTHIVYIKRMHMHTCAHERTRTHVHAHTVTPGSAVLQGKRATACMHTLFVLDSVPSHLHVLIAANWF